MTLVGVDVSALRYQRSRPTVLSPVATDIQTKCFSSDFYPRLSAYCRAMSATSPLTTAAAVAVPASALKQESGK